MKRTSIVNSYEAYPKTIIAQNNLYNNMSHHYRKLYNAKPCVDTSAPKTLKIKKQLNDRNVNNRPKLNFRSVTNSHSPLRRPTTKNGAEDNKILFKHKSQDSFPKDPLDDVKSMPFHPRILSVGVESKVRSLRDYHPPRKKAENNIKNRTVAIKKAPKFIEPVCDNGEQNYEEYEDDGDWLQPSHEQDAISASKPSSSDSAYTEEGEGMWSGGESREESPQQMYPSNWIKMWSDGHLYVKFLRTITDEVLRKGIYTNKALKSLFQEHINKNKHRLDIERMEKEVEKLQQDLGIPLDDESNYLDFGLGSGTDLPQSFVSFCDYAEVTNSIEELSINPNDKTAYKTEEWLSSKHSSTWSNTSEDIKISLKLPKSDNDNDSSMGFEVLTSSTDKNSIKSVTNSVEDRYRRFGYEDLSHLSNK